jgi:hypothetical protein
MERLRDDHHEPLTGRKFASVPLHVGPEVN